MPQLRRGGVLGTEGGGVRLRILRHVGSVDERAGLLGVADHVPPQTGADRGWGDEARTRRGDDGGRPAQRAGSQSKIPPKQHRGQARTLGRYDDRGVCGRLSAHVCVPVLRRGVHG